jgi:hypothetical protein
MLRLECELIPHELEFVSEYSYKPTYVGNYGTPYLIVKSC